MAAVAVDGGDGALGREREGNPGEGMGTRESAREPGRVAWRSSRRVGEGQAGRLLSAWRARAVRCFPSAFWREEEDNWQGRWAAGLHNNGRLGGLQVRPGKCSAFSIFYLFSVL